jgi:hypothetical protein
MPHTAVRVMAARSRAMPIAAAASTALGERRLREPVAWAHPLDPGGVARDALPTGGRDLSLRGSE